LQSEK
jgi:Phosphotransferase system mannitol/fructose-specific IIA domain (Ntr-type)